MPHVNKLSPQTISKLAPLSGLIMCITLVIYFVIRYYLLERVLPRIYGHHYTDMSTTNRRSFLNHHIAGSVKIIILIMGAYPFLSVAFGLSTFHTPMLKKSEHLDAVTMGDVLVVAAQMLVSMYVFELFYREKISPVSAAHHVGTIMIAQSAIAISIGHIQESDASIEFMLCTVWGAFDIICEFLPHLTLILYRVYPHRPSFLAKCFRLACVTTAAGTISETAVTMWLFGSLWDRWTLPFKIVTPMLHCLFAAAQMWGTYVFWRLWRKNARRAAGEEFDDEERVGGDEREGDRKLETGESQRKMMGSAGTGMERDNEGMEIHMRELKNDENLEPR